VNYFLRSTYPVIGTRSNFIGFGVDASNFLAKNQGQAQRTLSAWGKHMQTKHMIAQFAAATAIAFLPMGAAMAAIPPQRTVTVQGDFPDEIITAPIRNRGAAEEVLVPGGYWKNCARDCRQALLESTYDFWNTQNHLQSGQLSQ
jgi:hypothetical protein